MSPLITISPELSARTVLYRTVDFFSAAAMVAKGQFMFSRADTFIDRNEGIDQLLRQLEAELPGGGCGGMGWNDARTARREHDRVKRSHYISCWSRSEDSVAMWSVYSRDYCSVRLSTTLSKLLVVVEALLEKYSLSRLNDGDRGKNVVVATEARVEPVAYASLSRISARISRRLGARARLRERYQRRGLKMPTINEVDPRYWQREEQRQFSEVRDTCRLKDSSFSHEQEVRLNVRLGEETCSDSMLKLQNWLRPESEYHLVVRDRLKLMGWLHTESTPEREFVQGAANLIDTVALDPRCPAHKADFMREWFQVHGIRLVDSTCFGYLPDSFSVFPE